MRVRFACACGFLGQLSEVLVSKYANKHHEWCVVVYLKNGGRRPHYFFEFVDALPVFLALAFRYPDLAVHLVAKGGVNDV